MIYYKTPAENIEFGSTIFSRFDCIFIIKDKSGPNDIVMAEYVLNLHSKKPENDGTYIDLETLRNYIQYAKAKIFPTLSESASAKLNKFYVSVRQEVHQMEESSAKKSSIPITVRQLEAIIRLSESLAKIELSNIVTTKHVDEAIRLFQLSTMNAVSQGHMIEGMTRSTFFDEVQEVIQKIKDFIPIGSSKKYSEVLKALEINESLIKKAIKFMVKQNKLLSKDYGKILVRLP